MRRSTLLFRAATASFAAMAVLVLVTGCDSDSVAWNAVFIVLLVLTAGLAGAGFYAGAERRRLGAGIFGGLAAGVCCFFLVNIIAVARCGGA